MGLQSMEGQRMTRAKAAPRDPASGYKSRSKSFKAGIGRGNFFSTESCCRCTTAGLKRQVHVKGLPQSGPQHNHCTLDSIAG